MSETEDAMRRRHPEPTDSQTIVEMFSHIVRAIDRIERLVLTMSAELDTLTAAVTQNTSVDQSAITLLQGLSARLAEIANDPAAITALSDELAASSTALAQAVLDNTPAAPPV